MSGVRCLPAMVGLLLGAAQLAPAAVARLKGDASSHFIVRQWLTDDGLPQSSVLAIAQTQDGYLWLGTLRGLARFDGMQFTVYNEENTPGLPSRRVLALFVDSQDRMWIGTEDKGVVVLEDGKLRPFDFGRGVRSRLASVCEDSLGSVWLLSADGQLCRVQSERVDVWNLRDSSLPGGFSNCRVVTADRSGMVWVGSDAQLTTIRSRPDSDPRQLPIEENIRANVKFLLASRTNGVWRVADGRVQLAVSNRIDRDLGEYPWGTNQEVQVYAACEDAQDNLVLGTSVGVYWYDSNGKASHLLTTDEAPIYNWVRSLRMDQEGTLWIGTDGGGLDCIKRHPFRVAAKTESMVVQSVCEDAQGDWWIAANFGLVSRWHEGVLTPFAMSTPQFVALNLPLRSVFADRSDQIWAGVGGDEGLASGLYSLQGSQFRRRLTPPAVHQPVQAIYEDREGALWIGTSGGLVRRAPDGGRMFSAVSDLSGFDVRALADDGEGGLWIGTHGSGLFHLRDGHLDRIQKSDQGLPSDDVSCLLMDRDNVLWVGTALSGLARLESGKWTYYTAQSGLAKEGIGYLVEDGRGFLWAGTVAGLMRMRKSELNEFAAGRLDLVTCRVFRRADGLPRSDCTEGSQPAACQTRDGRLLFPTVKGLVVLNPRELKLNTRPPRVVIESAFVDGVRLGEASLGATPPKSVQVPPGSEQIELHYTSLNIGTADRTHFRYRMEGEGYETSWKDDVRNVRLARYPKMPPGKYRFHVIAANEDGVWNKTGATLNVSVLPPFWRTGWFMTTATLFLLGGIVVVVRTVSTRKLQRQVERMRQQEALEKERKRIARDLHDQLGASLTQVSLLGELVESDKDLPEDVEDHGRQITRTARETTHVLDEIVWAVNPSNDTLEGLVNYICKNSQDYLSVAGVKYRLEIPAQLPAVEIPPEVRHNVFLAAKESVTNVVRHAKADSAWLRLKIEPGRFILEIEDNGRGLSEEAEQKGRNGLRNMRRRMEDIGGAFAIVPGPQGGALVRLTVPLKKHRI